jgi:hypothetical protein
MFGSRVQVSRVSNPDGSVGLQLVSRRQGADSVDRDPERVGRRDPGRVVLRGVRGVQVGDRNLQVDEYRVKVNARVDLNEALQRGAVVRSLQALSRDPDDAGLRGAAVRALRSAGRPGGRTSFDLSSMRLEGGGLFVLRNQGVQYGDGNRQRNTFAYVVSPDLSATQLLAGNADLARALVDTVCPPEATSGRGHELQPRLGAAVDSARASIARPARAHALSFAAPATGGVLRVDQADGVQVGVGNKQRIEHDFTRGRSDVTGIRPVSAPSPSTLGAVLDEILTTITGETGWRHGAALTAAGDDRAGAVQPDTPHRTVRQAGNRSVHTSEMETRGGTASVDTPASVDSPASLESPAETLAAGIGSTVAGDHMWAVVGDESPAVQLRDTMAEVGSAAQRDWSLVLSDEYLSMAAGGGNPDTLASLYRIADDVGARSVSDPSVGEWEGPSRSSDWLDGPEVEGPHIGGPSVGP